MTAAARCGTCRHWTPRLAHVPPHRDVATRPTWGRCDAYEEIEMTTEDSTCPAWQPTYTEGTP